MAASNRESQDLVINSSIGQVLAHEWSRGEFEVDSKGLEEILLTEIKAALTSRRDEKSRNEQESLLIATSEEYPFGFYCDLFPDDSFSIDFTTTRTSFEKGEHEYVTRLVEDLANRNECRVLKVRHVHDDHDNINQPGWSVTIQALRPDLTIGDIIFLREIIDYLLRIPFPTKSPRSKMPKFDWETARKILVAGHPAYLIGQMESEWLEVKSQDYNPGSAGEIELSQDIARFANGDSPGLLVLGFREGYRNGQKVIDKLTPLSLKHNVAPIYHAMIDRRIYPPIRGLHIDFIPIADKGIVVFTIPKQQEEDKPFLVLGAVIDGKCEGAFISIVRRRGEHSIPITPAAIHTTLAAGRMALRATWAEQDT